MAFRPALWIVSACLVVSAALEKSYPHCGEAEEPLQEKPKPKGLEGVGLTAEQVNRAIDRGVDFVVQQIQSGKVTDRERLLAALALLHARALDRDVKIREAILKFVETVPINHLNTYSVGILAMVLDELGSHSLRLADCAKYLVETQGKAGSWNYGRGVPQIDRPGPRRRTVTVTGGIPIDEPGKPWVEIRRENPPDFGADGDNSTTQYAILGLRAAARRGVGIPKEVWERCAQETARKCSKEDGGWAYHEPAVSYGSMTAAAATTMAICAFHLDREPTKDEWVLRGAAWMAKHFAVDSHPPKFSRWHGYYLYSLERFGVVLGDEFFGTHEWYPLGARFLVDAQGKDGSWNLRDEDDPRLSTMFALLFLTRATPKLRSEIKRGGRGTLETSATMPGSYVHIILDASGSMSKKIQDRTKFDIAREGVGALVKDLPDGVWAGLRVYGHRKPAIDEEADTDSALEIPLGPLDRSKFHSKLRSLRCRGKTPLTYSLEQAAQDLAAIPAEASVTVLLLTDGVESTRGAKPERAAEALRKTRAQLRLVVVGFDVNDRREQEHLRAIAAAARGDFIPAPDAETLTRGLVRGIRGGASYVLFDATGAEVARGEFGDRHTLSEGKYVLVFLAGAKEKRQEIWINTDAVTRVVVDLAAEEEK